jgi:membrane protein
LGYVDRQIAGVACRRFIGALVTAVLFTIGKFVIGAYLGNSGLASTYGAAGSVVLLLV